jgi:heptosyltransferase II
MKILVIQQKMIGDVLTSSILFKHLRVAYPLATLDYLINSHTSAVVEHNPYIDQLILFSEKEENSTVSLLKFAKQITLQNYDIVIDIYSKLSSNIISYASKAEVRISYHKWYSSWIYTNTVSEKSDAPLNLALTNRLLLLDSIKVKSTLEAPKIYLTSKEINAGKRLLEDYNIDFNTPIYMISILGSSKTKTYPLSFMAKLLDGIVKETKAQLLFNYIPNQIEDVKHVYELCNSTTKAHIYLDVFGKSLREFLSLTSHCTALIGNEGGAINMAKALDIPTFTIFSPWIDKAAWSLFENHQNVSVHLKDFKPELYKNKTIKSLKKDVLKLYLIFKPKEIMQRLTQFLKTFS